MKKLLRSVLLSTKGGIRAQQLQGEYKALAGEFINHKQLGFNSLYEFIVDASDVISIERNARGETIYHAIADDSTMRIQKLVSGQKPKKKKKVCSTSYNRNLIRPINRNNQYSSPWGLKKTFQGKNYHSNNYHSNNYNSNSYHSNKSPVQSGGSFKRTPTKTNSQTPKKTNYQSPSPPPPQPQPPKTPVCHAERPSPPTVQAATVKPTLPVVQVTHADIKPLSPQLSTDHYKENVVKLLKVNPSGIHSEYLEDFYSKTFKEVLPSKVASLIIGGEITGVGYVEKFCLGKTVKKIIFPLKVKTPAKKRFGDNKPRVTPLRRSLDLVFRGNVEKHRVLKVGERYKVVVTHFSDCEEQYVQLLSEVAKYEQLCSHIKSLGQWSPAGVSIEVGMYVITPLNMRAKVLSVRAGKALIYNIDIGSTHQTAISNLMPMPPALASMSELTICCSMHRPEESGKWNFASDRLFEEEYLESQDLEIKVAVAASVSGTKEPLFEHQVVFYENSQNINAKIIKHEKCQSSISNMTVDPMTHQPTDCVQLPSDDFCNLFILDAPGTTEIEACIIGEGFSDKLVKLETLMQEYYNEPDNANTTIPSSYPLGCVYAVVMKEGCMRGSLEAVNSNQAKVYLVDNGEYETVKLNQLRVLTDQFAKLPMQAVLVGLAGLDNKVCSGHYDILEYLERKVVHNTFVAKVVGKLSVKNNLVLNMIDLIDVSYEHDVLVNDICLNLVLEEVYKPQLPTDGSFLENVVISHMSDEHNLIYIQVPGKMSTLQWRLDTHYLALNNMKRKSEEIALDLYVGKLCLAMLKNQLYRVQICGFTNQKPRDISVFLVDYGRKESVARCSLFQLESESLFCIPKQAVCCQVADVSSDDEEMEGIALRSVSDDLMTKGLFQLKLINAESRSSNGVPPPVKLLLTERGYSLRVLPSNSKVEFVTREKPASSAVASSVNKSCYQMTTTDSMTPQVNKELCEKFKSACSTSRARGDVAPHMKKGGKTNNETALVSVRVLKVDSPDKIQLISNDNYARRGKLLGCMNQYYRKLAGTLSYVNKCREGSLYAMMLLENSVCNWYRVRVESTLKDLVSVFFIDYGTFTVVKGVSDFRLLRSQFSDNLPEMVWFAKLAGIAPLTNYEWPSSMVTRLSTLLKNKTFYCDLIQVTEDPNVNHRNLLLVTLCDTKDPTHDVWINDLLVDGWKVARYLK